jgi:hypothetical protein
MWENVGRYLAFARTDHPSTEVQGDATRLEVRPFYLEPIRVMRPDLIMRCWAIQ